MRKEIIRLENIEVRPHGKIILSNLSLHVNRGEIVALAGPNGAGKSTILKIIFGMMPTDFGSIFLSGKITTPQPHKMARSGVSYVPQGQKVFGNLSVRENLELEGLNLKNKQTLKNRIGETLLFFPELEKKLDMPARTLSGGQQQMVALARVLIADPKLLLLDEPLSGLSPKVAKEVILKIKEINQKKGITILIVEHNIASALSISSRTYFINQGRIVSEEYSKNIKEKDLLSKVFNCSPRQGES